MPLRKLLPALLVLTCVLATVAAVPAPSPSVAYPAFGLLEGSGLVASVQHPGVVWVMEDSGDPIVHAYGPGGAVAGSITMEPTGPDDTWGGDIRDAESLALGPGQTLWVADIGDNNAVRTSIVVHEVPEPAQLGEATLRVVSYRFTYPAGPRDAETYLVDPVDGRAYIVTKGLLNGGMYAAPATLTPNASHELEFVQNAPAIVTDGSFSPDGSQVVLRTAGFDAQALLYDVVRGGAGEPVHLAPDPLEIELPHQEQGESICFTPDGKTLLTGSEGVDEPIWAVPIPDASDAPPATTRPTAPGSASASSSDGPAGSGEDGDLPTNWIAWCTLVLIGTTVAIGVAIRRRQR